MATGRSLHTIILVRHVEGSSKCTIDYDDIRFPIRFRVNRGCYTRRLVGMTVRALETINETNEEGRKSQWNEVNV